MITELEKEVLNPDNPDGFDDAVAEYEAQAANDPKYKSFQADGTADYGDKTVAKPTAQPTQSTPTEAAPQQSSSSSQSSGDEMPTKEHWADMVGISTIPEEPVITNEQRIRAMTRQNQLGALGNVLTLIMEGAAGGKGMYVDKRAPNPYMERTYQKIQQLKDMDLLESKRLAKDKIARELAITGMYNTYLSNLQEQKATNARYAAGLAAKEISEQKRMAFENQMAKDKRDFDGAQKEADRKAEAEKAKTTGQASPEFWEQRKEFDDHQTANRIKVEEVRNQNRQLIKDKTNQLINESKGFVVDWKGEKRTLGKNEIYDIVNKALDNDYNGVSKMFDYNPAKPNSTNDLYRIVAKYYPTYLDSGDIGVSPTENLWGDETTTTDNTDTIPDFFQ